jgi:TRAP-type C4-dicarboxylate transport system permease small subunit
MAKLKALEATLIVIEEYFVILTLAGLTGLQIVQVAFRYFLNRPLAFVDETSRYIFIWMVMVGAGLAMAKLAHFEIDFLTARMPGTLKTINSGLVHLVTLVFTLGVVWYGFRLLESVSTQITAVLEIPFSIPYASILAGCGLMTIHLLCRILWDVSSFFQKTQVQP